MKHRSLRRALERLEQAAAPVDHELIRLTQVPDRDDGSPYWSADAWAGFLSHGRRSVAYPATLTAGEVSRLRNMAADAELDMDVRRVAAVILETVCGDIPAVPINRDKVLIVAFREDWLGNNAHELERRRRATADAHDKF